MKHIEIPKLLFFLVAGVCVSLSCAYGQTAPAAEQVRLQVVGTNSVGLGAITCEESKTFPFRLRNVSTNQVKISALVPTCHCITATCEKMELAPGEETVINMTIDPSEIMGRFHRGLWVKAGTLKKDFILLSVSGEAIPMFTGGPESPLVVLADHVGTTITNRYTLTAAKPGFLLGAPVLAADPNMGLTVTLTTNAFETLPSYDLTLILKPCSNGFHSSAVKIPVASRNSASTLKYVVQTRVGARLSAVPASILVPAGEQPVQIRVRITAEVPDFDAKRLTWAPQIEGLTVTISTNAYASPTLKKSKNPSFAARKKSNLFVNLTLTPAAVAEIMTRTDPELHFQYPSHDQATIRFVTE